MNGYQTQSIFLKAISHPVRLAILDILRDGEQCVCHIETALSLRQAYISQQLTTLKDAGLVEARRDGLNLYYRVIKPEIFELLDKVCVLAGITPQLSQRKHAQAECPCPKCNIKTGTLLTHITTP